MSTIRIVGRVDEAHQLTATVPTAVPAGTVEVVLIVPERQDIYSLTDGEPADEAG